MMEIKANRMYINEVDNYLNFIKDDSGIYWYDYFELCNYLLLTSSFREKYFVYNINENDKNIIGYNDVFGHYKRSKFITTKAVSELISRNNQRNTNILKSIIDNETRKSDEYPELYDAKRLLEIQLSNNPDNLVDLYYTAKAYCDLDACKLLVSKYDKTYDIEKENMIQDFRDMVYEDYNENDEIYFGRRLLKKNVDEKITFTKNKIKDTTLPTWLKEVVK